MATGLGIFLPASPSLRPPRQPGRGREGGEQVTRWFPIWSQVSIPRCPAPPGHGMEMGGVDGTQAGCPCGGEGGECGMGVRTSMVPPPKLGDGVLVAGGETEAREAAQLSGPPTADATVTSLFTSLQAGVGGAGPHPLSSGGACCLPELCKSHEKAVQELCKNRAKAVQELCKSCARTVQEPFKSRARAVQESCKS